MPSQLNRLSRGVHAAPRDKTPTGTSVRGRVGPRQQAIAEQRENDDMNMDNSERL